MKTSVVVATYNGAKYITKQLESIAAQSVKADEVTIFDDCSTDNSVALCRGFIASNNLNNWQIVVNSSNKGFYGNFMNGIYRATGDIIFLSDQDDIWLPNKIERISGHFKANKSIQAISSAYGEIDGSGVTIFDHVKLPHRNSRVVRKIDICDYCIFSSYLGMAGAIRRELLTTLDLTGVLRFDSHDRLLNFYAVLNNGFYFTDERLSMRRIHGDNVSIVERSELEGLQIKLNRCEDYKKFLYNNKEYNKTQLRRAICKYIDFYDKRIKSNNSGFSRYRMVIAQRVYSIFYKFINKLYF